MKINPYLASLASRYQFPAFVDETGTGSIFGDVSACAVILNDKTFWDEEVDDSKKLCHEKIYRLAPYLKKHVIYSIGHVTSEEVVAMQNSWLAGRLALSRAVQGLKTKPDALFIDGPHVLDLNTRGYVKGPEYAIPKGDSLVFGIAVASIISKDFLDHFIVEHYAEEYSQYHIRSNLGYRSPMHLMAIRKYGVTPHHRTWMPQIKKVLNGGYDEVINFKLETK